MRLAKARVKAYEDIPEEIGCCEPVKALLQNKAKTGDIIKVDLDDIITANTTCTKCSKISYNVRFIMNTEDRYTHIDALDIDEGSA